MWIAIMTNTELKAARESLTLTQVKMARLLGMTQPHYCRLENGREGRQPTKQQSQAVKNIQFISARGLLDELLNLLDRN